jgi:FAD/FMN-containing dehydrogenase
VLELTGEDLHKVAHAYGTNGIITEVEMPLTAAYDWVDVIVGFDSFMGAASPDERWRARTAALKNLHADRGADPQRLLPAPPEIPERRASHLHRHGGAAFRGRRIARLHLAGPGRGTALCARQALAGGQEGPAARLRAGLEPHDAAGPARRSVDHLSAVALSAFPISSSWWKAGSMFPGDEVLAISNSCRFDGKITCFGLPLVRFTTEERLDEIIASMRTMAARSSIRTATRWRRAA